MLFNAVVVFCFCLFPVVVGVFWVFFFFLGGGVLVSLFVVIVVVVVLGEVLFRFCFVQFAYSVHVLK